MYSEQSLGFFDSGVGGTSIWKEVRNQLPLEHTIYLADSKYAPYGPKGKDRIIELSIKNTEFLLNQNCKLIIVACNTATTSAIHYLRAHYKIPFIGIEPAIKPAALKTKTKAIGILATKGTLSSALFHKTSQQFASDVFVLEQEGEGIVQLIESGKLYSKEMNLLLTTYLKPMIDANIDYLVLGCSHYPYLIPLLKTILPPRVTIIDSGIAVARQTEHILKSHAMLNTNVKTKTKHLFYTNSNVTILSHLLENKYDVTFLDF